MMFVFLFFFQFVLLARANLEMTLAAEFKSAQYHLFLAAMLFGNIRNRTRNRKSPRSRTVALFIWDALSGLEKRGGRIPRALPWAVTFWAFSPSVWMMAREAINQIFSDPED